MRFLRNAGDTRYGTLAYRAADGFPCMERRCRACGFETLEAPLSPSDALTAPPPTTAQADGADEIGGAFA